VTTLNGKIVYGGLAKQSAKGSAAANPLYTFGVTQGQMVSIPITQELQPLTLPGGASDRFQPHSNRTAAIPAATFTVPAWSTLAGLAGLGVMGTDGVTGAGPYTHAETPTLTLPYFTLFVQFANGDRVKLPDCLFDRLKYSWDGRNPVMMECALLGLVPALGAASFTNGTDLTTAAYFDPIGGTFQHDADGITLGASPITAGEIEIANNLKAIELSKALTPDDYGPGVQAVSGSFTIVPADLLDLRSIIGGGPAATAVSNDPVYGSFSHLHQISANEQLTLAANRVAYMTDYPDADADGNPMPLTLAFEVVRPTDGSAAFTHTVKNSIATY
jgi:hypothetical protein